MKDNVLAELINVMIPDIKEEIRTNKLNTLNDYILFIIKCIWFIVKSI